MPAYYYTHCGSMPPLFKVPSVSLNCIRYFIVANICKCIHLLSVARGHPPPHCENTQVLREAIIEDDDDMTQKNTKSAPKKNLGIGSPRGSPEKKN